MKPSLQLVLGGLLVSAVSIFIGAAATFAWLARPMEKWGVQFSETYLPLQAEALQALRQGRPEPALVYLETAATFSLDGMSQQRSKGANVPRSERALAAVRYLCANPPVLVGASDRQRPDLTKACATMGERVGTGTGAGSAPPAGAGASAAP